VASGKYQYLSQKFLNWLFNSGAFTQPTNLYLALFSIAPTISTTGTEATGSAYARVTIACNTTNWPTISGSTTTVTSGAAFTFPTATGNWSSSSNQTDAGLWDAASTGNLLYWGDLTTAKPVLNGDTASFASGAVTVQET
jgi:hypothetical protein